MTWVTTTIVEEEMAANLTERRWLQLRINPISIDANSGIITVADVSYLAVKMKVTLTKPGQEPLDLEVGGVLSPTTFWLQKPGGKFNSVEKPIEYSGGELLVALQERNPIGGNIIERAVYQEEPVVAIRTIPVSKFGNFLDGPEGQLDQVEPRARFIYGSSSELLKLREFSPLAIVGDYCKETQFVYGPSLEVLFIKSINSIVTLEDLEC